MRQPGRRVPRTTQPQGPTAPASQQGLELLFSGGSAAVWVNRGWQLPSTRDQDTATWRGISARSSFTNAEYQKLSRVLPLTLITVGVTTATQALGTYQSLIASSTLSNSARGGIELGVGGDLGGGGADLGRVYSVVRSPTYTGNETLIKTTATVARGQVFIAMQRITASLHELFVHGVGSASTATIAAPGANDTDSLTHGSVHADGTASVLAHARFTRYVTDSEWLGISANPWQLFAPIEKRIWALGAVAAGGASVTPGLATIVVAPFAPTLSQTANVALTPATAAVVVAPFAPTLGQTANVALTPGLAAIAVQAFAPTVQQGNASELTPGLATIAVAAFAPTLTQTTNSSLTPGLETIAVAPFAPTVTVNVSLTPGVRAIAVQAFAPTLAQSGAVNLSPGTNAMVLQIYAPTLVQSGASVPLDAPIFNRRAAGAVARVGDASSTAATRRIGRAPL